MGCCCHSKTNFLFRFVSEANKAVQNMNNKIIMAVQYIYKHRWLGVSPNLRHLLEMPVSGVYLSS